VPRQALAGRGVGNERQLRDLIAQLGQGELHARRPRPAGALVGDGREFCRSGVHVGRIGRGIERLGDGRKVLTRDAVDYARQVIEPQDREHMALPVSATMIAKASSSLNATDEVHARRSFGMAAPVMRCASVPPSSHPTCEAVRRPPASYHVGRVTQQVAIAPKCA